MQKHFDIVEKNTRSDTTVVNCHFFSELST